MEAALSVYSALRHRELFTFKRGELQDALDAKGASGQSFSVVDHLRWDMKQITAPKHFRPFS